VTVIVSSSFAVSPGVDGLNADSPIIGYNNLVSAANISATTEDPLWPASNMANVSTYLKWKSGGGSPSSEEYITLTLNTSDDVDYVGIAGHNLGTSQAAVSIEGNTEDAGSPQDWVELVSERLLPDDKPAIFRFTGQPFVAVRIRIQESLAAAPVTPYMAVVYAGKLLVLQRRIYVGHTPLPYGRTLSVANHRSISGAFLGRVVLSRSVESSVNMQNLTPSWFRQYLQPFLLAAQENPFFFAWRPGTYPEEAGFVWLTGDPKVSNQRSNGMMQMQMNMSGIVS
jgi:hypothetical protein